MKPIRKKVCITFVGDVRKDSRTLRFAEFLARDNEVTILALGEVKSTFELHGFEVRQFHYSTQMSLRKRLLRFWKEAGREAALLEANMYFSADLYSLPVAARAASRRNVPLFYDSRELYSDVAALVGRPFMQWFWIAVEKYHARHADIIFTVNASIAALLRIRFPKTSIQVIRNLPRFVQRTSDPNFLRTKLNIPPEKKILLSQGGVQKGRGGSLYVAALKELTDCVLVFIGDGDYLEYLRRLAETSDVSDRVFHIPAVASGELFEYTRGADLGLCVIENLGRSYYLSLPNKLFEYLHAGLPVVGSNFPELSRIIDGAQIGLTVSPESEADFVTAVRRLLDDDVLFNGCKTRCIQTRNEYSWDMEERTLQDSVTGRF